MWPTYFFRFSDLHDFFYSSASSLNLVYLSPPFFILVSWNFSTWLSIIISWPSLEFPPCAPHICSASVIFFIFASRQVVSSYVPVSFICHEASQHGLKVSWLSVILNEFAVYTYFVLLQWFLWLFAPLQVISPCVPTYLLLHFSSDFHETSRMIICIHGFW